MSINIRVDPESRRGVFPALALIMMLPAVAWDAEPPTAASQFHPIAGMVAADFYSLRSPEGDSLSTFGYRLITHFRFSQDSPWSVDLNLRNNHYLSGDRPSYRSIYDAKVTFTKPAFSVSAGRMSIYDVGSMGTVDGVRAGYGLGRLTVGGFGGYVPNFTTAAFSTDTSTFGGFATYLSPGGSRSDVAVAEVRHSGSSERRFLSLQNFLIFGPGTSLFQSLEYELGSDIPSANRLSRFMASGSAVLSPKISVSGSFMFGRPIDYRQILMSSLGNVLITDPAILGSFYYENVLLDLRYRISDHIGAHGGFTLFKRSENDLLTKQVRVGVAGIQLADTSIGATYARSFETSAHHGVLDLSAVRSFGNVTLEFDYSNYSDYVVLTDVGSGLLFTPVPGYQIFGGSASVWLTRGVALIGEVQEVRGANDYTSVYLRTTYRFK